MSSQTVEDRYTSAEIRRYEAIFGRHFISPGGLDSTRRFLELVQLGPESRVLDVGCGIGGSAFYMARSLGCHVDGIDLSSEMIRVARQRVQDEALEDRVRFFEGDCLTFPYPRRDYHLIYSRDVFLHIDDKRALLASLRTNLAASGRLLFTDYIRGCGAPSDEFRAYVDKHGYRLESLESYQALLTEAGYAVLRADDLTGIFLEILERELAGLPHSNLESADVRYLEERWKQKISRAGRGEQGWALFLAQPAG